MTDTERQPAFRWVVLIAAAVILALSMGLLINGLTVFFVPLEKEFGWQRGDIALINTFGLIGLAIGGIAMGRMADRFGTMRICLFGAVVLAARVGAVVFRRAIVRTGRRLKLREVL